MDIIKKLSCFLILLLPVGIFAQESPENYQEIRNRALQYFESGDFKKAIPELSKAIQLKPHSLELIEKRAIAFKWRGKPDQAFDDFSFVINNKPTAALFAERASVRHFSEMQEKYDDLVKAVNLEGNEFDYIYQLAMLQYETVMDYYDSENRNVTISITSFKDKFGFSPDACPNFNKAAELDSGFKGKASYYCQAINDLLN